MELKKIVKKVFRWGTILYLAAHLSVAVPVFYDYFKYNRSRIEQSQPIQTLKVHKYKSMINGEEKYITLVGESHLYNQEDYNISQKLVDEHKHFATEVGFTGTDDVSLGNLAYCFAVTVFLTPAALYLCLGSGRWYEGVDEIAEERGYKIYPLENTNDILNNMSKKEKLTFLGKSVLSALVSPVFYYYGKNEEIFYSTELDNSIRGKEWLIDKRDKAMAESIIDLLEDNKIDKLLANFGRGHLEGIIENLSEQIMLEEIK